MKSSSIGVSAVVMIAITVSLAGALRAESESEAESVVINPDFRSVSAGYGQSKSSSGTVMRKFNIATVSIMWRPEEGPGGSASARLHAVDFRRRYSTAVGTAVVLEGWFTQPLARESVVCRLHVRPFAELDLGYSLRDHEKNRYRSPKMLVSDLTFRPGLMLGLGSNPGDTFWQLEAGPYVDLPMYRHVRYTVPQIFANEISTEERLYPETHFGLQISGQLALGDRRDTVLEAHARLFNEWSLRVGVTWRFW